MTDNNKTTNGLEALALEADNLTGNNPQPGTEQPEEKAPAITNAEVIAMAIGMGRDVFCMASTLQSPKKHLDDTAVKSLGDAWGAVCDKRGLDLNAALGDWGVEIGALVITAQIGYTLKTAVTEEIRARNAKPVEADAASGD